MVALNSKKFSNSLGIICKRFFEENECWTQNWIEPIEFRLDIIKLKIIKRLNTIWYYLAVIQSSSENYKNY